MTTVFSAPTGPSLPLLLSSFIYNSFILFFRLEDSVPYDPDAIDIPKELKGLCPGSETVGIGHLLQIHTATVKQQQAAKDDIRQTTERIKKIELMEGTACDSLLGRLSVAKCRAKHALRHQVEGIERIEKLRIKLEELNQRIAQHAFENRYRHSMNQF